LIEESAEGVFLYSIRPEAFIGDTWHPNIEAAKAQAAFEANSIVGPWRVVPAEFGEKMKLGKTRP